MVDRDPGRSAGRAHDQGTIRIGHGAGPVWLGSLVLLSALAAGPAQAATFMVTTNADAGAGSLREAITLANGNGVADTINFTINPPGAKTITLASALPGITQQVTINGTTQPGWVGARLLPARIEMNAAGGGAHRAAPDCRQLGEHDPGTLHQPHRRRCHPDHRVVEQRHRRQLPGDEPRGLGARRPVTG